MPSLFRPAAGHLVAAVLLPFAGMFYSIVVWGAIDGSNDFTDHLSFARDFYWFGRPPVPHFLFHGLTAALYATGLAGSFASAARAMIVGCYLAVPLLLYGFLWALFRNTRLGRPPILLAASLATLLAQPITRNHAYMLGFFWPEPYHSPTMVVLKPFAIAGFAGAAWYLSHRSGAHVFLTALFTLATVAGALSKPSFLICLVPAVTVLAVYRLARKLPVSVVGLLAGLYLPAAVVLGWQAWFTYSGHGTGEYHDAIRWAPFKVMGAWTSGLTSKLLLSIAFPLAVTIWYWEEARRDTVLQLSWLCFLFGAFYSYMLAETTNWLAGNFTWSGDVTAFTLFIGSVAFWLRQAPVPAGAKRSIQWAFWLSGAVLLLHAISGVRLDWFYLWHHGCAPDYRGGFICRGQP
ncbi:MAG TPA: hypothetical protein VHW09_10390 [Bryobacteraceae bacterium]|jgi:hypothetical protein|nr:hypothetical protein [Bryobacteraceae bacterium]